MDECKNRHKSEQENDIVNEEAGELSLEQKKKKLEKKKKS